MAYVYIGDNRSPCNKFSLDIVTKLQRLYLPLEEDNEARTVSLEETIEPLSDLLSDIEEKAKQAKLNCANPPNGLSCDESASIYLYSMRWEPQNKCLYFLLNATLRNHNPDLLKPWILYLNLLYTALDRLPSTSIVFYQDVESNFLEHWRQETSFVCWEFTSCSLSIPLSQSKLSSEQTRKRTVIELRCSNAKYIEQHSSIKSHNEILFFPAQFQFLGYLNRKNDLDIIQLKEINPSFPLIQFITISKPIGTIETDLSYRNLKLEQLIASYPSHSPINLSYQNLTIKDIPIIIKQAIIDKQCTKLLLYNNCMTTECLSMLVSVLANNQTLEELDLSNADISDEGVQMITQTLALNSCSIKRLDLRRNPITDKSVQYLIAMFVKNTKLNYIHLFPNSMTKKGIKQIIKVTTYNKNLTIS